MQKIYLFLIATVSFFTIHAQNGRNPLSLKDITEGKYKPETVSEMRSMPDGEHYTILSSDGKAILQYAYKTGRLIDTLFHVNTVRETKLGSIEGYLINSTGHRILVWNEKEPIYRHSWRANMYDYDVRRNFLKPLSDTNGKIMIPTFSPDGRMAAYVRDNNIWLKKFDFDTESQVTKDGEVGKILNGITDWVYEEEFTQTNLMSFSADNQFLAFLKSEETYVPTFSFQIFDGSLYPSLYSYKYPKAGKKNSVVGCYVFNVDTRDTKKMNVPLDADGYIPCIRFTENADQLAVMALNRTQNNFNMYFVNPRTTVAKLVLRDDSQYYINYQWINAIAFSADNFVYVSEKDGFAHIYLYSMTGTLEKQVTSGNWDVTKFYGFDPKTKAVYYQSAEESPLNRSVYKIDARAVKTKLSSKIGYNDAQFSSNFQYFTNYFSNATTPTSISIYDEKGKELAVLKGNEEIQNRLANTRFSQKEFFNFVTDNGYDLNGWMIKPSNFDSSKKYPVVMIQYSGPNSQIVLDKYDLDWYYYLAEQAYIVAAVDGRGTGARGENFRKSTYLKLGILESDDQIATAKYLGTLNFVDKNRIAIWGWSYGGFTTLMSMSRGNGIFKAGIAIVPVTDWTLYNSIYTERYMRTPQENFNNYDLSSPIQLANQLQGNLLIIHGTSDDNVHYQNTLYYADALVEAGKNFEMQTYSNKNHSLPGAKTRHHLYTRIIDFLSKNL
jgi:dipeptidyl-peptidase-4